MPKTFPAGWLGGVIAGLVVALVAWLAVGAELAIPVLILTALLAIVAVAYRTIGTSRTAAADNTDTTPRLNAEQGRPLGDTPEAHDEINPHDLPPDHPGRHEAERMAEGDEGETAGMAAGGAAGDEGPEEGSGEREPTDEAAHGARTTET
jgi:predicted lipid-binding transport protein (Tim44 family)